jgi:hypothetical protein
VTNPYPGARPLGFDTSTLLFGRQDDIDAFVTAVTDCAVVELAGPSGVGKSSLIRAGFVGQAGGRADGQIVRLFNDWSAVPVGSGAIRYAWTLARALQPEVPGDDQAQGEIDDLIERAPDARLDPVGFIDQVQRELGSRLVVIFDQLEELLRHDQSLGRTFLRNVAFVANRHRNGFTQVIALRDEYVHHLRLIEERLDPGLWRYRPIKEVAEDCALTVVRQPLTLATEGGGVPVRIADELVDLIAHLWRQARRTTSDPANSRVPEAFDESAVGLLHLQGFLFALYELIDPLAGGELTVQAAETVVEKVAGGWPDDPRSARRFFALWLEQYVKAVMTAEAEGFVADGRKSTELLEELADETRRVLTLLPEHLSSAGFKLARGTDELAATVLTPMSELHTEFPPDVLDQLGDEIYEFGGDERNQQVRWLTTVLARLCREARDWRDVEAIAAQACRDHPWLEKGWGDETQLAGRLRSVTPIEAASELVVTYERALRWLEAQNLVRLTSISGTGPRPDDEGAATQPAEPLGRDHVPAPPDRPKLEPRIVALVHDGFGNALRAWAARTADVPAVTVALPVAITAKQVFFRPGKPALTPRYLPRTTDFPRTTDLPRITHLPRTTGLVWIGCNVTTDFDGITFYDCDFASTLFRKCRFTDVVFENCRLDGVLFFECTFQRATIRNVPTDGAGGAGPTLKSVTIGQGSAAEDAPLRFEGLRGAGLFIEDFSGQWELDHCSLHHVVVSGPQPKKDEDEERDPSPGPPVPVRPAAVGRIVDSDDVWHLDVGTHVDAVLLAGTTTLKGLAERRLEAPPGVVRPAGSAPAEALPGNQG